MSQYEKSNKPLQASDLERITGVTRSTLYYYVKQGLLSEPKRTGKTMAYYSTVHLDELEEIKRLRNLGYPLSYIKGIMDEKRKEKKSKTKKQEDPAKKREDILVNAVNLFSNNGYHKTKMTDIAEASGVSRSTLYLLFENKQNLFLECADTVIETMISDILSKIEKESDPFKQVAKTCEVTLKSYPHFLEILNYIDYMVEEDPSLKEKGRAIYDRAVDAITGHIGLREALDEGNVPLFIPSGHGDKFASYGALGMAKLCYSMSILFDEYGIDDLVKVIDTTCLVLSSILNEKIGAQKI